MVDATWTRRDHPDMIGDIVKPNGRVFTVVEATFQWHALKVTLTWRKYAWDEHDEAAAREQVADWPRQHVPYSTRPDVRYG
jgi:hypothetical protein